MNQSDYQHPKWQEKRLEIMQLAGFVCQCCGNKEGTLHVHHVNYAYDRPLWDYKPYEYVCLCDNCHNEQHNLIKLFRSIIARLNKRDIETLHSLLSGMNCVDGENLSIPIKLLNMFGQSLLELQLVKKELEDVR